MKIIDKNTWERYDLFRHYDEETKPFINITVPVDITNLYHFCKENNYPFYCTMGYVITKVINQIDGFKYRKENDKIKFYDTINTNYTEMINEERIGYFTIDYIDNFDDYVVNYQKKLSDLKAGKLLNVDVLAHDEIWVSCAPWFTFTALETPYDKNVTIPQFVWDQFKKDNDGHITINLMIMVHHGFVDGFQINQSLKLIQNEINTFKGGK